MSTINYRFSRRAIADLEHIADYLGRHSAGAAARVLDTLLEAFEFLGKNPRAGIARDDLHPHLRMFVPRRPASAYVVFYYPASDGIEVSDVIHASRDWIGMFERGDR